MIIILTVVLTTTTPTAAHPSENMPAPCVDVTFLHNDAFSFHSIMSVCLSKSVDKYPQTYLVHVFLLSGQKDSDFSNTWCRSESTFLRPSQSLSLASLSLLSESLHQHRQLMSRAVQGLRFLQAIPLFSNKKSQCIVANHRDTLS